MIQFLYCDVDGLRRFLVVSPCENQGYDGNTQGVGRRLHLTTVDLTDMKGQAHAKRALEVAAAGRILTGMPAAMWEVLVPFAGLVAA